MYHFCFAIVDLAAWIEVVVSPTVLILGILRLMDSLFKLIPFNMIHTMWSFRQNVEATTFLILMTVLQVNNFTTRRGGPRVLRLWTFGPRSHKK